jgi:hypothetical protein
VEDGLIKRVLGIAFFTLFLLISPAFGELLTPAEISDFRATPRYNETLAFIDQLAAGMPELELDYFGLSAQGRPMPVVIVSKDRAFTPEAAAKTGKAIVMVQSGIHSGEIDGKDACLMLLRDMAEGKHKQLLDSLILLIVPIYNVDGHERVSPYNRANQDGPELGQGFRTTADGHDLNRDHLKLDTPEASNLIGLFNDWRPHLHVDTHVTNGADHAWVLTYSWAEAPQVAPSIDSWLVNHMPAVLAATEEAGHPVGPYVGMIDYNDPSKGIRSYVGEPRYSTGYFPLRNRPSILTEAHAYKPYRDRVLATRAFLLALFEEIAERPGELIKAIDKAERRTIKLGRPGAEPSDLILRYKMKESDETVQFPVYEWYMEPSQVMGGDLLRFRRGKISEMEVPWQRLAEAELTVERPRGYLILPGWPVIEQKIDEHGLQAERLTEAVELAVETMRLSNPRAAGRANPSYQGRHQIEVDVERGSETRTLPVGALWIPAEQPDFEVAAQLFEPDAPDSLVSWGMLSLVLERKEYIDSRVLEGLALEMLQDPATAAAWEAALESEEFAADSRARWLWWYKRTKHWDESVGLMPVMRLLNPAPFKSVPWSGPYETR